MLTKERKKLSMDQQRCKEMIIEEGTANNYRLGTEFMVTDIQDCVLISFHGREKIIDPAQQDETSLSYILSQIF